MQRPLVVTDPSDRAPELIREAGQLAAAQGVPVRVLAVVSSEEFEKDSAVIDSIAEAEGKTYDMSAAEYAKNVAQSAISDLLTDIDVEAEPLGRAVKNDQKRAETILDVANDSSCDYIFLIGQRRRPTGKAVFGDTAQQVILNFDGYVVTATE
ncbi:universal stress protein [Salinarchaeum laminariae]|uniref:universal stress protein n=1 Tax=Salinarchaeum laminariae TaxID=869888 RepID=UPI0020BEA7B2|nr:universal stress protein [Salinarchaeum laminariae]